MMISKKALPRRTFLRGAGAAVALPLLDAMVPAFARSSNTAANAPMRLGIVYVPNGMWPMDQWTPRQAGEGPGFELTAALQPLQPFREQLVVVTGLAHKEAIPVLGEASAEHSRAFATYLTGVRPRLTEAKDPRAGISVDQIVAEKFGKETQLASLEVALFPTELVGVCENGITCTFVSTLSWRTPARPNPMETNPRAVFERLFGETDSTDRAERLARIRRQQSILDWVLEDLGGFMKQFAPSDRARLTEYLDAIRDTERRIQLAEQQSNREVPTLDKPVGVPGSFEDYAKLMMDLQVLAYQADLTRVITFAMGREGPVGGRAYPEIDIPDMHHTLSHHQNNATSIEKLLKINVYHTKLFAYFVQKLKSTPDGDGSVLDRTILLYGSGLSDGNAHQHTNLPMLLVAGGGAQIKGGRHIRCPEGTPMTNLHLTVLDKLGLPTEKFGDSTGKLDLISV